MYLRFAALGLVVLSAVFPATAFAQGCHGSNVKSAQISCANGLVWDETAQKCVMVTG